MKLLHVPYRGGVPAATAVAGRRRADRRGDAVLGAIADRRRQDQGAGADDQAAPVVRAADWPTLAEQGLAVDAALWVALFAPAGTPQAIVDRLDSEVVAHPEGRRGAQAPQ